MERTRRETLRGKPLHGKFFRKISGIADERTWQWLNGGYLTKATEGYVMAAQEQALRTRWVKAMIDGEADVDPMCRLCGVRWETVTHLVSGCGDSWVWRTGVVDAFAARRQAAGARNAI